MERHNKFELQYFPTMRDNYFEKYTVYKRLACDASSAATCDRCVIDPPERKKKY